MAKKRYQTAQNHLRNVTELGEMFDLNRDTVRKRLSAKCIQPFAKHRGVNVYIVREAAEAIIEYELREALHL
ncbi:hypothetical protein ABT56_20210 [Photobacterium aquae]|uniref:DNA-binding protein n=1 Tax=Photobacterium aquae TaxID=1195763 RepID=A0A0J1GU84_9GAMM|nr:hypothetical protein [Photobacterium aquae]KLV03295.1 hypothetical protein ABT56_20210 [Photobacterium aquae]